MSKRRAPSPARSQGGINTPKRKTNRGSRSLCSPALSTASGRLTSLIDQFKDKNMESFALSPLNRRSVLNDNTEIEEPRCKSWWKKLDENSQDVMKVLEDNKLSDSGVHNVIEEFIDIEVYSQEKNSYTLDLPESSDNESIKSIVLPQRRLFTQKENQPQKKYGNIIVSRESLAKLHKTNTTVTEKTITVGTRELFSNAKRSKPIFPAALLNIISPNKTAADKTKENVLPEPKAQVRNIFGNRPANKRKNMFADFIVSESEDEIPDIQPKIFGFQKRLEQRRISSVSKEREGSPMSSITTDMELDDWKLLPSSTMVENQLEDHMVAGNTPIKRARLSKLSEAKESDIGTTLQTTATDKTKQSNKSVSSKNKSKASPEIRDESLNNSRITRSMLKNGSKREENVNTSIKKHAKSNKSQNKISFKGNELDMSQSKADTDKQNTTLNKSLKHNGLRNKTDANKSLNDKEHSVTIKVHDKVDKTGSNDVEQNVQEDDDNNFTLEYKSDDNEVVEGAAIHNDLNKNQKDNTIKENTVAFEKKNQETEITKSKNNKSSLANKSIQKELKPVKTVEESVESQNEQYSADDNVDGNVEQEPEIVENQESKGEEVVSQEIDEEINSHEDRNEENVTGENDEENEVNVSQESEKEANESYNDEANVSQDKDEHNESEEEVENENQEVENEDNVSVEDEDEANESDENDDDANVSDVNEDEGNESQAIEAEVNESQQEIDEEANESQEIDEEANESQEIDEEAHESEMVEDDDVPDEENGEEINEDDEKEAVNEASADENQEIENDEEESHEVESEAEVNESEHIKDEHQVNDSDDADKEIASDPEISDQDDNQADDIEVNDDGEQESENEDVSEQNQHESHEEQNQIEPSAEEIEESPDVTHDTTGRHRKKDLNKSPEVILQNKTNQMDSFTAKGRNTSVRKTKSMIKNLNIRPSLAIPRDSIGFSDGTTNSSAEGSGWDSHRTTRKTLRQTFGKDFTPRKSLRALVMEKYAKRQTEHMDMHSDTVKFPQANSTELPEYSDHIVEDIVESDHEVSINTRLTTLKMHLQKIKQQNIERELKMEEFVRNSLKGPVRNASDTLNLFKVPNRPAPRGPKPAQNKPKKQIKSIIPLDELPPDLIEAMKYKPPKRFKPSNASWITKRLYKFLESKLEPKYDYKARVRAEKLVETIYHFTKDLRRHRVAPTDSVEVLKNELARLDIVRTHFEFYEFFHEFMPREVRIKVNPDIVNKIALPRHGVFSDILRVQE